MSIVFMTPAFISGGFSFHVLPFYLHGWINAQSVSVTGFQPNVASVAEGKQRLIPAFALTRWNAPDAERAIMLDDATSLIRMHRNQQVMASQRCTKCGGEMSDSALVCPTCNPPSAAGPSPRRSPVLLIAVIALCLGAAAYFVAPLLIQQTAAPAPQATPPPDVEGIKARAEKGEAAAQAELATLFTQGDGVKRDYKEAAKWYQLAADQGFAKAQAALGELYEAGQGVPRDDAEAAKWYRKAADQGLAAGQYALAVLYLVGRGVPKDDTEALKLYRQSADQGYALALFHLGMRYKKGQGVPVDPVEAYKWLTLAAAGGIAEANEIRDEIKSTMTRAQIAEGRQRAEAFSSKPAGSSGR